MPPRLMRWVVLPAALVLVACLPGVLPEYVMFRQGFIAAWMLSGLLVGFAGLDAGYVLPVPGLTRALEYLGSRSYALYLVHQAIGRYEDAQRDLSPLYVRLVPDLTLPWVRVLILFASSLAVAELLHRAVERPCIRLGRRLVERAAQVPTAPG